MVKPATQAANQAPTKKTAAKRPGNQKKQTASKTVTPHFTDFPVVGVGCSAGGLEALEAFLSNVPGKIGMAFVVIQHLDPSYVSSLPGLLQRATEMTVVEAGDGMPVKPDCVYVIPPNKDISILNGRLQLLEPAQRRGLRLPVDFFLRSLAAELQHKAIGVILSGMGSDGMLGLAAIKEKSGLTLAQTPETAKADSMPRSAINAGVVDIVAPPEELAARITDYLRLGQCLPIADQSSDATIDNSLDKIIALLRIRSGNDFSLYKPTTLYRRIERRTGMLQIDGIADYVKFLQDNPQELDLLFKELLIGVTNFFRDPILWEFLRDKVIPELLEKYARGRALRAWVPACSTGEEAYSLAIIFKEALERIKPDTHFSLQIYATDLDADAIDRARKGVYPENIVADVSPERLSRYFTAEEGTYRVARDIREMVIFAPQNIISDPPFTKLDFLSCRNLLIYFSSELQKKILPLFHYALNRHGILILGSAETVGNFNYLFSPMDKTSRVFTRNDQSPKLFTTNFPTLHPPLAPAPNEATPPGSPQSLEYLTDQFIQQNYAPAAVLVNTDGDIIYISGRTGKYLEPAAGKVNINIHAMAREGLRDALTCAIRNALYQAEPIHLNGLQIANNGNTQTVNVTIQCLKQPEILHNRVLIVFTDVDNPSPGKMPTKNTASERESALTLELQQTRQALRSTHEEMQTSVEEAKSANEELQASNEELTTSKEELQSMNEELQTVNAELQSKVDDLTWARNDMANLLNSTAIATIFLDSQMKLRRYTTHATHLFKFIPGDIGRPLSDIVTDLDYPQMNEDAIKVLNTLVFHECQANTQDNRWYRVRIMPYRTQDNVIDGVVITFIDITEIKNLEAALRTHDAPERQ